MLKKLMFLILLLIFTSTFSSCTQKEKIDFYKNFNENSGELAGLTDNAETGKTFYAVLKYGKPFEKDSIGLTINQQTDKGKSSVYDYYMKIKPDSDTAVIPFEITDPGEYDMVIYFDDQDHPIAQRALNVIK